MQSCVGRMSKLRAWRSGMRRLRLRAEGPGRQTYLDRSRITRDSRDILSNPAQAIPLFWLPAIVLVVTGASRLTGGWQTAIWTTALCIMGAACMVNAVRCRRVHCYLTGPFFLLMALVTLLYGLGLVPLGTGGWNLIGMTILIGAIVLCCLPELFLGRYRKGRARKPE